MFCNTITYVLLRLMVYKNGLFKRFSYTYKVPFLAEIIEIVEIG